MRGFGLGLGSTMGLTSERIVWRCGSSWPPQGMVCWSAVRAPTAHAPAQRLCIVCKYVCARPYLIKIIPRSIHYMLSVSWNTIFTVRKICTYAAGYVFISCIKTIQLTKQNIATPSSGICGAGSKLLPKRFWRLGEFPCLLAARPRRKRLLGELLLLRGWIFRGCRCHSNNSSSCSVWPAPCDAWSPSETCRDQDLGNNGELKVLHLTRKTSKGKKWKDLKKNTTCSKENWPTQRQKNNSQEAKQNSRTSKAFSPPDEFRGHPTCPIFPDSSRSSVGCSICSFCRISEMSRRSSWRSCCVSSFRSTRRCSRSDNAMAPNAMAPTGRLLGKFPETNSNQHLHQGLSSFWVSWKQKRAPDSKMKLGDRQECYKFRRAEN